MKRIRCALALVAISLSALALVVHGKEKRVIDRQLVENMFTDIRAKTKWNIDGPMLWGYFFTDTDRKKLLAAAAALEKKGYRYVGIREPAPGDDDQKTLSLHVEREEIQTVQTLDARNQELSEFAELFHLDSYDGMDAGPIPKQGLANKTPQSTTPAVTPPAEQETRQP